MAGLHGRSLWGSISSWGPARLPRLPLGTTAKSHPAATGKLLQGASPESAGTVAQREREAEQGGERQVSGLPSQPSKSDRGGQTHPGQAAPCRAQPANPGWAANSQLPNTGPGRLRFFPSCTSLSKDPHFQKAAEAFQAAARRRVPAAHTPPAGSLLGRSGASQNRHHQATAF